MSIKDCIFITESYARFNGREKGLTPGIDAARAEHEALLKVARLASELTCCTNEDKDGGYFLCEEAAPVLNDLLDVLEELK